MMVSLLCPTRGRPAWFKRLHDSVAKTASGPWEIVAVLDEGDDAYDDLDLPNVVWVRAKPGTVFSDLWNVAWHHARGDIFQLAADDMVHKTQSWDRTVAGFMPFDGIGLLCPNDMTGYWDTEPVATLGFVSARWCDTLGYFTPPYFESDYCDVWMSDLAVMLKRFIRIPIECQHLHWTRGWCDVDETYAANLARKAEQNPDWIYRCKLGERLADAAKLAEVMTGARN